MDVPESLILQAIDQLTFVAKPFANESTDLRAKNAARVLRELKAHHERHSSIVARKPQQDQQQRG